MTAITSITRNSTPDQLLDAMHKAISDNHKDVFGTEIHDWENPCCYSREFRSDFMSQLRDVFKTENRPYSVLREVAYYLSKPKELRDWEQKRILLAKMEGLYKKSGTGNAIRQKILNFIKPTWSFEHQVALIRLGRSEVNSLQKHMKPGEKWSKITRRFTGWSQIFLDMIDTDWDLLYAGKLSICQSCNNYIHTTGPTQSSLCEDCIYLIEDRWARDEFWDSY
jgi:hypothetical protein